MNVVALMVNRYQGKPHIILALTLAQTSSYFTSGHYLLIFITQTILVLVVASTTHRQTYKQ